MTNTHKHTYSLEAERAVLGSIILDNKCWDNVSEMLTKDDFYYKPNRIIFDCINQLMDDSFVMDLITLSNCIIKKKKLDDIGGVTYIRDLLELTPTADNVNFYIEIVKEKSTLRALIKVAQDIVNAAFSDQYKTVKEIIDIAEEKIFTLSKKAKAKKFKNDTSDLLVKTLRKLEECYYTDSKMIGLSTGFKNLDKLTLGFQKSDLIVIAGRPSIGKTSLALNMAEHMIMNLNQSVLIITMEMSSEQIVERMIGSLSHVNLHEAKQYGFTGESWARLSHTVQIMAKKYFYIHDEGPLDILEIKSTARKIMREDKSLSAIIIDYMQLASAKGFEHNRTQELAHISRALKSLARELDIPIIALSQLNRSVESRLDKRPLLSDIRESGAIEQDADVVLFIYRDEIYQKTELNKGTAEIIIAKQRNGPTGSANLRFVSHLTKFENEDDLFEEYWHNENPNI